MAADRVTSVGVVGAGVIGSGWALHFLRMGLDVRLFDPMPAARDRAPGIVESLWPVVEELGLRDGASLERLEIVDTLEAVVDGTQVVQEATPEVLDAKIETFARLDALAPEDTVLLSSTSGLSMTAIQSRCERPEVLLSRSAPRPGIRSTRRISSRSWRSSAVSAPTPPRWTGRSNSTPGWTSARCAWTARSPRSSAADCRRRCGARRCT
jgi:hypothetical protein